MANAEKTMELKEKLGRTKVQEDKALIERWRKIEKR